MSARTCPRGSLTKVVRYSPNTLPTSAAYFSSFWNGMTSPRLGCGTLHGLAYRISPRRTISYAGGVFTAERPAPKPRRAVPKEQWGPLYQRILKGHMGCFPETTPYGGLRQSRRDAVGRYEKGPGGNGIARRAMILVQLALGPLPEAAPVGIDNEGISIRDAGPKRAPEGAAEQPVQVGMEESARRQPVAGCDYDHAPPVPLPRPFQLGRPGEPAQVCDGHLVEGLSIRLPAVRVRGGHEPENVIAPEGVTDHHI